MIGHIRTVGGDRSSDDTGPVYAHEHLIIDSALVAHTMPHIHLASVGDAVAEVSTCVAVGVRMMVDAMPAGSGRDPVKLSEIAARTGIAIVAATGLHTARYYVGVDWANTEPAERLAERFVADIEEGIDANDYRGPRVLRTGVRAGVIKVAALAPDLTPRERTLFEAAALAHHRTHAPILTHTEGGLGGIAQIEALSALGVPAHRIALSHTDKVPDDGYHREMLSTGVYLCYDQGLRDPPTTVGLADRMLSDGYGRQIVLGTDGARRDLWSTLGGSPGLDFLYTGVGPMLDGPAEALFQSNPARWLTFSP